MHGCYQSSSRPVRRRFSALCRLLSSNLLARTARRGFVALRCVGGSAAFRKSTIRRARADSRFCACVRFALLTITRTPSLVTLRPPSTSSRSFKSSGSEQRAISRRNSTAVASRKAFWPPDPIARTNRSWMSRSLRAILSVTRVIGLLRQMRHGCRSNCRRACTITGTHRVHSAHWIDCHSNLGSATPVPPATGDCGGRFTSAISKYSPAGAGTKGGRCELFRTDREISAFDEDRSAAFSLRTMRHRSCGWSEVSGASP